MDKSLKGNSEVARLIWVISPPIIFVIGVLGNILTIAVLSRKHIRKTSTNVFLTGMAFADLIVMLNTLPRWWLIYVFDVDIRLLSDFSCKTQWFFAYVGGTVSSLIIAAMTIERIISTVSPHKVKTICTTKSAFALTCFLFLMTALICSHIFFGFELVPLNNNDKESTNETEIKFENQNITSEKAIDINKLANNMTANGNNLSEIDIETTATADGKMCVWYSNKHYETFYITSFQTISFVLCYVIPQVILVLGGFLIVRKIAISTRLRKRMTNRQHPILGRINKISQLNSQSTHITRTLMLVNVTFFVCITPSQIFMLGRAYWVDMNAGMTQTQEIIWAIVNMMYFINFAIDFILYFLSGARFRREFVSMLRCRENQRLNDLSQSRMTTVAHRSNSLTSFDTALDFPVR